ncbi:MAG: hypothetical protein P8Y05_04395 [Deinococcales bacterium]
MREGGSRRDLLPALLIAAGVLWLLFEIGFVPPRVLAALSIYWPLLLVGVGLDLLRVRRPWAVPYTALAAIVVVLAALFVPRPDASPPVTAFHEPVGAARSASVHLELSSSASHVFTASDASTLLDAQIRGRPAATFEVRGDRDKTITVRPQFTRPWVPASFGTSRWDLALGPGVPLDLRVDGGSGSTSLDLAGLHLTGFRLDGGSGAATLTLPGTADRYRASVQGGSGPARIDVTAGASLDLSLDMGSGSTDLVLPPGTDAQVSVRGGSGPIRIDVPTDAAVRLEARNDGSGPLRVASFLERQSGSGDIGVWESAAAHGTAPAILITVADAGSGSISIR